MNENDIAKVVVDSALRVHRTLGPGLLESVYEESLAFELASHGFQVERQLPCEVTYNDVKLGIGFRLDILVNDLLIIEIKSIDDIAPVHQKQLLTYLKLKNKKLGLLINFNVALIKDGIQRVVNSL